MNHCWSVSLCLLLLVGRAGAETPGYYERAAEGWFWYRDPPPAVEPAPEPPPPPPPAAPTAVAPPAPAPFSVAWFQANLNRYRDAALDNPTPANVAAYYYLQRLAMDKSSRFADVAQQVVLADPWLDETVRRPLATFAANEMSYQSSQAAAAVLRQLARVAGLWFFYRADCPYCHQQAGVLAMLERQYGFAVTAIALDGQPLPDGRYPDYRSDAGQAQALGVVATPALFLVRPDNRDVLPLGQGALALDQLVGRMLRLAAARGWIAPADYQRTRPLRADWQLAADGGAVTADMLADPARLVAWLRQQAADNAVRSRP